MTTAWLIKKKCSRLKSLRLEENRDTDTQFTETNDDKRLLWAIVCHKMDDPDEKEEFLNRIAAKIDSRINKNLTRPITNSEALVCNQKIFQWIKPQNKMFHW